MDSLRYGVLSLFARFVLWFCASSYPIFSSIYIFFFRLFGGRGGVAYGSFFSDMIAIFLGFSRNKTKIPKNHTYTSQNLCHP